MDIILHLMSYSFYIIFLAGMMYALKLYLDYSKYKKAKTNIANLEAKVITLKMALKVKIKVKINSFRSEFAKIIEQQKEIAESITELAKIQYDESSDFQKHFDLSRQINTLINTQRRLDSKLNLKEAHHPSEPEPSAIPTVKLLEEFMGPDYKNEISIIRIIKEIADARFKLSQKIVEYNEDYKNHKSRPQMKPIAPLEFTALADINRVFEDSDVILNEMQRRQTESKATADQFINNQKQTG